MFCKCYKTQLEYNLSLPSFSVTTWSMQSLCIHWPHPYLTHTILLSYILLKISNNSHSHSPLKSICQMSKLHHLLRILPVLMTLGSVICSLLLTLLSPFKETEIGLGVRYLILFSNLWVMASSGVITIEVESSISATLVLEESSQTAMASRGVVSGKRI